MRVDEKKNGTNYVLCTYGSEYECHGNGQNFIRLPQYLTLFIHCVAGRGGGRVDSVSAQQKNEKKKSYSGQAHVSAVHKA